MAYHVNVAEWSPDGVGEWLKGLDDVIVPYIQYFVNNQVDGKRLLQLTPDELPSLHVTKIGHQEIILQGIELLRNVHYQLHQENVQFLALRLSSKARSIYNELRVVTSALRIENGVNGGEENERDDDDDDKKRRKIAGMRDEERNKIQERVSTTIIAGVADVLSSVKGLVSWLNRQPFIGIEVYDDLKTSLVELSIKLATISMRDKFAENQATVILKACLQLAQIADRIIQEYSDPLIIQPASLDIATIKKKADDEWGVVLLGSYHGIHQVSGVRNLSPAHQCGKLEEGDELIQVNLQTVVGWSPHKVLAAMQESPIEVILTIKKRPCHANTVTQIYFKPFRLPSKKRTYSPWGTVGNTARYDLQSIPNLQFSMSHDKVPRPFDMKPEPRPKSSTPPPIPVMNNSPSPQHRSSLSDIPNTSGSESEESDLEDDAFLSENDELCGSSPISVRLYHPKPRVPVQRRATIPGASATSRTTYSIDELLQDVRSSRISGCRGIRHDRSIPSDPELVRPSGIEARMVRPHTCIGTGDKNVGNSNNIMNNTVLNEEKLNDNTTVDSNNDSNKNIDKSNDSLEGKKSEIVEELKTTDDKKKVVNVIPLPPRKPSNSSFSSDKNVSGSMPARTGPPLPPLHIATSSKSNSDVAVRIRHVSDDRPKLDKSHSTPAYDELDLEGSSSVKLTATITEKSSHTIPVTSSLLIPPLPPSASSSSSSATSTTTSAVPDPSKTQTNSTSKQVTERIFDVKPHSALRNRRISCRDLGQGDHQGWLYRRRDNKGFLLPHRWERRWFILKKNYLYGYKDREAMRADSLVYLPGFHVCPASDVKSKKFTFKIYHSSGATFYFACETSEERSRWMSQMGLSAISSLNQQRHQQQQQNHWEEVYYSETDEELDDRSSPARPSPPQPSQSRISPNRDSVGSLWRGNSASPNRRETSVGSHSRGSSLVSLSSSKNPALRFLQPPKDNQQPVPTASFRSYRRVSENSNRSTSTGDLRGMSKFEGSIGASTEEKGSSNLVTRKNSLRDKLKQIPASFTLERRKQSSRTALNKQDAQKQRNRVCKSSDQSDICRDNEIAQLDMNLKQNSERFSESQYLNRPMSLTDTHGNESISSEDINTSSSFNYHQPHYMLPTCASSSYHTPVRPSSVDLDTRNCSGRINKGIGRICVSPPSSGRCSPTKAEHNISRRGSIGGESPIRSASPRRGSLDCLVSPRPRALSPPVSPLNTPTRSSHGSASSLLASEEYREGSPEKLWINSLRTDHSKSKASSGKSSPEKKDGRSRSVSGDAPSSDRLKRTALYHPPQLKGRGDSMKAAFELALDPNHGTIQLISPTKDRSQTVSNSSVQVLAKDQSHDIQSKKNLNKEVVSRASLNKTNVSRPEVPPRTKFLSPSERKLPRCSSITESTPVIVTRSSSLSPSPSIVSSKSVKSTSSVSSLGRETVYSQVTLPLTGSSKNIYVHSTPRSSNSPSPHMAMGSSSSSSSLHEDYFSAGPNRKIPPKPSQSLTIPKLPEESEIVRTPLKPAMGVSMIGKQRRTPAVMSPRDVFFASPPASPIPLNHPPASPTVSSTNLLGSPNLPATSGNVSASGYPITMYSQTKTGRNQKILPHYPGMEYPPVFEPGSYSLCGSPPPGNPSLPYQSPADLKLKYGSDNDSVFNASLSSYTLSDSSFDFDNENNPDTHQQQELSSRENNSVESGGTHNNSLGATSNNFYLMNHSGVRSPQNIYVTLPMSASRSHQNLYVKSPGSGYSSNQNVYVTLSSNYSSNQNIYISTPAVRSSSHQNIYVTSPVTSVSPGVQDCVTTSSIYSSSQIIQVGSNNNNNDDSPSTVSSEEVEGNYERLRLVSHFPTIEENIDSSDSNAISDQIPKRQRQSSLLSLGPPRLHLPGPPKESPPESEEEACRE